MRLHEAFNRSALSRFLNSPAGRVVRVLAGAGFVFAGLWFRHEWYGVAAMVWSVFPLTAGGFDVCYISAALGGPFSGAEIRRLYGNGRGNAVAKVAG